MLPQAARREKLKTKMKKKDKKRKIKLTSGKA
jgi:hypothetical protein